MILNKYWKNNCIKLDPNNYFQITGKFERPRFCL